MAIDVFVCRNHNLVLPSCMTYQRACNKSNTTGAGMSYVNSFGALEFATVLVGFVLLNLCIVSPSIYRFWLPLWYFQFFLYFPCKMLVVFLFLSFFVMTKSVNFGNISNIADLEGLFTS
jgi:hypothetical protein